jgi:hypothetical protein
MFPCSDSCHRRRRLLKQLALLATTFGDWSICTITSFISTFVAKGMTLVDLCLASIARATVRSVRVLRTFAEELTLPNDISQVKEYSDNSSSTLPMPFWPRVAGELLLRPEVEEP